MRWRLLVGVLTLVAVILAIGFVVLSNDGARVPVPADAEHTGVIASANHADAAGPEEPGTAATDTGAVDRADVVKAPIDVPGTRVTARIQLGDTPLGHANVEVWHRPYRAKPTRIGETATDAGGRFTFDGIGEGRHAIALLDDRAPIATVVAELSGRGNQTVDLGDLVIRAGGSVAGLVVDESGAPIADVNIQLEHGEWSSGLGPEVSLGLAGGKPGSWPSTETDANGRFRFDRIAPGRITLKVDAVDYLYDERYGEVESGRELTVRTTKLKRGRRVDGRVVDWTGAPVADARITAIGFRLGDRTAVTNDDGLFTLTGLPKKRLPELRVEADEHVPIVTNDYAESGVAEFRLPRGYWIRGRILGVAAENVVVRADSLDDGGNVPFVARNHIESRSFPAASDRSFRVGPMPNSRWKLWADAGPAGTSPVTEVAVVDEDVEVDLTIPKRAGVVVSVRMTNGEPVAFVPVFWEDGEDIRFARNYRKLDVHRARGVIRKCEHRGKRSKTDANGLVTLPIDLERPFCVAIQPDEGPAEARAFLDGERPERIAFEVVPTGIIRGRVLGLTPKRAKGWSVLARSDGTPAKPSGGSTQLQPDGTFEIPSVPVGRYHMGLHLPNSWFDQNDTVQSGNRVGMLGSGLVTVETDVVEVQADETSECEFTMPALGRIRGVVRHRSQPIEGCQVFALTVDENGEVKSLSSSGSFDDDEPPIGASVSISGADGHYAFHAFHPGHWEIRLRHPNGHVSSGPWRVEVTQSGQDIVLDLELGGTRVDVSVASSWSWPKRGQRRAFLFRENAAGTDAFRSGHHTISEAAYLTPAKFDDAGRARLDYVPAGRYVLRIVAGHVLYQRPILAAGHEDIEVGPLEEPKLVDVALRVETETPQTSEGPLSIGIVVHALLGEPAIPAFHGRAYLDASGKAQLVAIPPGRYRVQAEAIDHDLFSFASEPLGRSVEVEIHADGSTTPAALDLR